MWLIVIAYCLAPAMALFQLVMGNVFTHGLIMPLGLHAVAALVDLITTTILSDSVATGAVGHGPLFVVVLAALHSLQFGKLVSLLRIAAGTALNPDPLDLVDYFILVIIKGLLILQCIDPPPVAVAATATATTSAEAS